MKKDKLYYPLAECKDAEYLYISLMKKFKFDKEDMNTVIQAIYDSYMDQNAFCNASKKFLCLNNIPYQNNLLDLSRTIIKNGKTDIKERLLIVFWTFYSFGHQYTNDQKMENIDFLCTFIMYLKWMPSKEIYCFDTT